MEKKKINASVTNSGGNASKNSLRYRIQIPSEWAKEIGISRESKELSMSFDGKEIIIRKNI